MEYEQSFDEVEDVDAESSEQEAIDIEAVVKKARKSRQIEEVDVQAILASADEDQAERLYEQLQRLGIRIVSETGETVEDLGDTSTLLDVDLLIEEEIEERQYAPEAEEDPVHTYLKEIGQVPLLTSEQEIWLATQLAAASVLVTLTTQAMEEGDQETKVVRTVMANYESVLEGWQQAIKASELLEVELPDLSLVIREAQQLRGNWKTSSPS